jgi:hypothetical protein
LIVSAFFDKVGPTTTAWKLKVSLFQGWQQTLQNACTLILSNIF